MIAAANIEKTSPAQWNTCGAAATQTPGGVEQAFSETLLEVSKASSGIESASDSNTGTARRRKPEDAQEQSAASDGSAVLSQTVSQQMAPQQNVPTPRTQVADSNSNSPEPSFGGVVAPQASFVAVAGRLTSAQSNNGQPATGSPHTVSLLSGTGNLRTIAQIDPLSQTRNRAFDSVANEGLVGASSPSPTLSAKVVVFADKDTTSTQVQSAFANTDQGSIPVQVLNAVSREPAIVDAVPVLHPIENAPEAGGQTTGILPSIVQREGSWSQPGVRIASEGADAVQASPSTAVSNAAASVAANANADRTSSPVQSDVGDLTRNSLSDAVLQGVSNVDVNAESATALHTVVNASAADGEVADAQTSILQEANGFSGIASTTPKAGNQNTKALTEPLSLTGKNVSGAGVIGTPETTRNHVPDSAANAAPHATGKIAVSADADTALNSAQSTVANVAQGSVFTTVLKSAANVIVSADPVPAVHAALNEPTKEAASGVTSTNQPVLQVIVPQQSVLAAELGSSTSTAGQLASVNQPGQGLPATAKTSISSPTSASGTKPTAIFAVNGKDTGSDAAGVKQHTQSASNQADSQTGSQSATTSGDPNQPVTNSQGSDTAPAQTNFELHTVVAIAPVQNAVVGPAVPSASTHVGISGSAMRTEDNAAALNAVPQAPPTINSAKLIQSMGQTEMRVGMRSNEFGNISISTSSTRDSISAQISVDHSELAKELAAHLPEMQSRLGSDQTVNVRIDMNGGTAGQGAGTSGGMSNGSADQSRSGRQQSSNAASSYASNSVVERQMFSAASAATTGYGSLNARLDIRV